MHPILINFGSFHLPTFGVLLILAILAAVVTAVRLGRRAGLDSGMVLDFCTWIILIALVGAKVLMIISDWSYYRANPGEIFSTSTLMAAGVFYGGFLAALGFVLWYVRVQKVSFWVLADVLAPAVAVGQSIGRLGCFAAGCDYGRPTSGHWGVVFTSSFAHEVAGTPLGIRLYPTQIYEALATLVIFGILLWQFPKRRRQGGIFLLYVGLYAVARFSLEYLRGDEDRGFVFHHLLSTSQFIALLALAGVLAAVLWRKSHPAPERVAADAPAAPPVIRQGKSRSAGAQAMAAVHSPRSASPGRAKH